MQQNFNLPTPNGVGATVIAMMNQKGGVGKSTITTLLANVFFFQCNLRVAIIDADYPQFTILKRRKNAVQYIQSNPTIQMHFEQLYTNRKPISVYHTKAQQVQSIIEQVKDQYDLIFIDLAGTINQDGIGHLMQVVQHFFIPVLQDDDTFLSSIEFYQLLQVAAKHLSTPPTTHLFFNRIPHQNIIAKYRNSLSEHFNVLQQFMPAYTAYERELRSTLFPIQLKDVKFQKPIQRLFDFAHEIVRVVQQAGKPTSSRYANGSNTRHQNIVASAEIDILAIPNAAHHQP